jgi:hypothetical protein
MLFSADSTDMSSKLNQVLNSKPTRMIERKKERKKGK